MDKRFLVRAVELSLKSGCLRGKRGAVIVKDGQIVTEAFNQPLPDNQVCQRVGCLRDKLGLTMGRDLEKCRAVHAEAGAICLAAGNGKSVEGSTMYITCGPCMNCAKLIVGAGIKQIYYLDEYGDKTPLKLLEIMGIKWQRVKLPGDDPGRRLRDATGQE